MPTQRIAPQPVRDIIGALVATACIFGPVLALLFAAHLVAGAR